MMDGARAAIMKGCEKVILSRIRLHELERLLCAFKFHMKLGFIVDFRVKPRLRLKVKKPR